MPPWRYGASTACSAISPPPLIHTAVCTRLFCAAGVAARGGAARAGGRARYVHAGRRRGAAEVPPQSGRLTPHRACAPHGRDRATSPCRRPPPPDLAPRERSHGCLRQCASPGPGWRGRPRGAAQRRQELAATQLALQGARACTWRAAGTFKCISADKLCLNPCLPCRPRYGNLGSRSRQLACSCVRGRTGARAEETRKLALGPAPEHSMTLHACLHYDRHSAGSGTGHDQSSLRLPEAGPGPCRTRRA